MARPAGFQKAASPCPARVTAVCPMPTASAPTGRLRNRAPELLGKDWAHRRTGPQTQRSNKAHPSIGPPDRLTARSALEVRRLIDQHDGNVVVHPVDQAADVAYEGFAGGGAVFERPLALRTHQDLQQLGSKAHPAYPRRLSDGSWRRHLGITFTCSSRKTRSPSSGSILARAAVPNVLMVRPPSPITMPFWLSRSTYTTARIYTGLAPSRNSSISTATLYGSSSRSVSNAASRMNSAAKKRIG